MANALASFGLKVTYLGILGYPNLHPVFADFAKRAEVHSIAEPGYTDALEFEDGKIMLGKHQSLKQMNWENIKSPLRPRKIRQRYSAAPTWSALSIGRCSPHERHLVGGAARRSARMKGPRRKLFFDLADPEKRTSEDIMRALELGHCLSEALRCDSGPERKRRLRNRQKPWAENRNRRRKIFCNSARKSTQLIEVDTLVVHPTSYALACGPDGSCLVEGPFTPKPKITTGAGDHFNSGFCLGKLLGFRPTNACSPA